MYWVFLPKVSIFSLVVKFWIPDIYNCTSSILSSTDHFRTIYIILNKPQLVSFVWIFPFGSTNNIFQVISRILYSILHSFLELEFYGMNPVQRVAVIIFLISGRLLSSVCSWNMDRCWQIIHECSIKKQPIYVICLHYDSFWHFSHYYCVPWNLWSLEGMVIDCIWIHRL